MCMNIAVHICGTQ